VADLLAAKGSQIGSIVTTAYNPAVASAAAVKQSGRQIKVIAIDDDPTILADIKDGSVTASVVQNPYGQAYVGGVRADQDRRRLHDEDPRPGHRFRILPGNQGKRGHLRHSAAGRDQQLKTDFDTKYLTCE